MIYIAICDDNKKEIEKLEKKVRQYLEEKKEIAEIFTYTKSSLLKYDIQEGKYFDIVLTDIEMPDMDGMKLVSDIKKYLPDLFIIFITAYLKYVIDAFELAVFRYIPKNMLEERLNNALSDAIQMLKVQSNQYYMIHMPTRLEKIPYQDILYIQKEGKNGIFYLKNHKTTFIRKSLKQILEELSSEDFVYIDRGIIVNLVHIIKIKKYVVELTGGIQLQASHSKLEIVKNKLYEFWEKQL